MSPEEKQDLSVVTCNIISETEKFDVATKIKEINLAREKMGEDLFLGSGNEINNSFKYDLCVELVINDDEYELKLQNAIEKEKEEERLARIQREEERIRKAEEERLARIQREEEERLARIQREEEEKKKSIAFDEYMKALHQKPFMKDFPIIIVDFRRDGYLEVLSGYTSYGLDIGRETLDRRYTLKSYNEKFAVFTSSSGAEIIYPAPPQHFELRRYLDYVKKKS